MNLRWLRILALCLVNLTGWAFLTSGAAAQDPAPIKINYVASSAYLNERAHWAFEKGAVKIDGVELDVKYMFPAMYNQMLLAGEAHAGAMSLTSYMLAKAKNAPLEALVTQLKAGSTLNLIARKEITGVPALRGKRVGLVSFSDAAAVYNRAILQERFGIPASEITWIAKAPPILVELLRTAQLEAAVLFGDAGVAASKDPGLKLLYSLGHIWKEMAGDWPVVNVLVVHRKLLEQHPGIERKLVDGLRRANAYGIAHDKTFAREFAIRHNLPNPEKYAQVTEAYIDYTFTALERKGIERVVDYAVKLGLLEKKIDVSGLFSEKYRDLWR